MTDELETTAELRRGFIGWSDPVVWLCYAGTAVLCAAIGAGAVLAATALSIWVHGGWSWWSFGLVVGLIGSAPFLVFLAVFRWRTGTVKGPGKFRAVLTDDDRPGSLLLFIAAFLSAFLAQGFNAAASLLVDIEFLGVSSAIAAVYVYI